MPISTFFVDNWFDCGKPETLLTTNRHLLDSGSGNGATATPGTVIIPPVFIHPDAVLELAIVGPHATIGAGARVRNAMVRDAILGDGALVEDALVAGSLVGNGATVKGSFHRYNLGDSSAIIEGGRDSIVPVRRRRRRGPHRHGIAHRDLKPANVMVGPHDRVTVLTFPRTVPRMPWRAARSAGKGSD